MKYSLKGLIQFRGVSHVLKLPFTAVGLGKAMEPWITEEVLNKIADELIIKTQNMVVLAKNSSDKYDVFLMDVPSKDFNENYRQKCINVLTMLVKKHLSSANNDSDLTPYSSTSSISHVLSRKEDTYKFFNPHTTMNKLKSKIAGKDCDVFAKAQEFTRGFEKILFLGGVIGTAFVANINDVNVYSFDSSWAQKYQAKPFPVKDLLAGISNDCMNEPHNLGNYVIAWKFTSETEMELISLELTKLVINISFGQSTRQDILERIFGIRYKRELEALDSQSLFNYTMSQKYDDVATSLIFLKAKDILMSEAFDLYWEQIKMDNFDGINFEAIKSFFIENKRICGDDGNYLKPIFYQLLSSLTLGRKEQYLKIFDKFFDEVSVIFDKMFKKHLSLEFKDIIERFESVPNLSFGVKIIQDYNDEEINNILQDLQKLEGAKEIYICKPYNAEFNEILFFNNEWTNDLKKYIADKYKKIPVGI